MTRWTRAIGGAICLMVLLGACSSGSKKQDASKVTVQGKLTAEQCQKVEDSLTTLVGLPSGTVTSAEAKTASTEVSSAVGATSVAMQTVLVAVSSLGEVPAEQLAATASSVTSGGGYSTALTKIKDAIDTSCST